LPESFNKDYSEPRHTADRNVRRLRSIHNRHKRHESSGPKRFPSPGWFPIIGAGAGFLLIILLVSVSGQPVNANVSVSKEEWLQPSPSLSDVKTPQILHARLNPGDTSSAALAHLDFDNQTAHQIINTAKSVYSLTNVQAGHEFERINGISGIDVYYQIDADTRLHLHQATGTDIWQAGISKRTISSRQHIASGVIKDSLFSAAAASGMDERTTMNLVDIFAWDIDFARDIRNGDSFKVLYEERFDSTGKALNTTILAAEFVNQGKRFRAVRYEQANGQVHYFTPDGKSMRKSYLKAPVKFSRISSRFQTRRKHPILGYTRAHRGVDYAASSGTAIHAIGDGRIEFAGWKGGYGRFLLIRHTNRSHSTAYAHMRAFARGIKKGVRVHQGEVIGYVGMTGLATGPHLHFEFRVRGRAVNPLTVKRSPARPIQDVEMARFQQQSAPILSRMEELNRDPAWG